MIDSDPPAPPRIPRWLGRGAAPLDPPVGLGSTWATDDLDPDFPDVEDVALVGERLSLGEARTVGIVGSHLTDCELDVDAEVPLEIRDSVLVGVDLTGRRVAGIARSHLERCRLGGADLAEATVRDVTLSDCVLDLGSWRMSTIERVHLDGGRADGLDWTGATLVDVRIAGVDLDVVLDGARATRVDLTGARIGTVAQVATLAGCTISPVQAIELVPRLAGALGIAVRDGQA